LAMPRILPPPLFPTHAWPVDLRLKRSKMAFRVTSGVKAPGRP
jgi:hypothetical protein